MADANQDKLQFLFTVQGLKEELFTVVSMEGYEAISKPYRFTVTLMARRSDDNVMPIETMLARGATLKIKAVLDDGRVEMMPYQGVLEHFEELQKTSSMAFYRTVLTPRFARTRLDRRSELYTKKQSINLTLADILKDAIKPPGSENVEFKLGDTYPLRDSVCQYDESTFDFVSRWLEKEGMFYYFDHTGAVEKMVVVDNNIRLPAGQKGVYYRPNAPASFIDPIAVQEFTSRSIPLPQFVSLRDFNHLKAGKSLQETATIPKYAHFNHQDAGEIVIYGEDLRDQGQAQRYAKLRAEEIACGRTRYFGSSTTVGLRSGYFLGMADVPLSITMPRDQSNKELKMEFLVTEIQHQGSQAKAVFEGATNPFKDSPGEIFYRNTFTAIHRSVQFRPARTTPKPSISGTMSAIIATEQDANLDLDEQGMYKLKMPFAQDKNKPDSISTPVRMATPYAGSHHGMDFPLHRDTEVLLSFINGDPDQPVIMNAVPNSENPAIVNHDNPLINQIRTAGGNYITMNDDKGKQSVRLDAANHRGTFMLGAGSLGESLHFSPKGQVSIAGLTRYDYVGAPGSASVTVGSRFHAGLMNDVNMLKEHLTYTGKSDFSWADKDSAVRSMSFGSTTAVENVMRTTAKRSITLEAGYDELELKTNPVLSFLPAMRYYMTAMKFANYLPGMGVMASALRSLPTATSDLINENVTHANFSDANYVYNLDAFTYPDYASMVSVGSIGAIHSIFKNVFNQYAHMSTVSRMNLSKEGIDFKFAIDITKPQLKMSMNDKGIVQSVSHNMLSPTDASQYLNTDTGAGMMVTKDNDHASVKLGLDGNVAMTGSKDIKISGKSMSLASAAANVSVDGKKIGIVAQEVQIGFEVPSPQRVQVKVAEKQLADLEMKRIGILDELNNQNVELANLVLPGAPSASPSPLAAAMDDDEDIFAEASAAMAKETTFTAKRVAIEAKLAAVEVAIATAKQVLDVSVASVMVHGLTVSSQAVEMKTKAFGITASNTDATLGNASAGIKVNLMCVAIDDGKLIKIG